MLQNIHTSVFKNAFIVNTKGVILKIIVFLEGSSFGKDANNILGPKYLCRPQSLWKIYNMQLIIGLGQCSTSRATQLTKNTKWVTERTDIHWISVNSK